MRLQRVVRLIPKIRAAFFLCPSVAARAFNIAFLSKLAFVCGFCGLVLNWSCGDEVGLGFIWEYTGILQPNQQIYSRHLLK